jgi:hypothetical protein
MKKLSENKITKKIFKWMGEIPSIFIDEYYTDKILENFKKRHELIWTENIYDYKSSICINQCIFKFKKSNVYLYLRKRDDENTYSLKVFFHQKNLDSIRFLISSIKEHKTI